MAKLGKDVVQVKMFGWLRQEQVGESKLVMERECVRAAKDWPPLEAPGWAHLDVTGTGCGPGWGVVDQEGATLQRDHVDWQWPQPG